MPPISRGTRRSSEAMYRSGTSGFADDDDFDTAHGSRRRHENGNSGNAGCSSPLAWLYARIFVDLREEDDTFEVTLRKIVISVGLILAVFPVSFAVYLAAEVSRAGVTAGNLSTLLVMLFFPLVWVPSYLVVRSSKYMPDALLDVWLLGTTGGVGILAASFVEYPIGLLALFLAIMALLCSTPRLPLHLACCFIVYAVAMLNNAFSGLDRAPDVALLALPDPYRGTVLERVAYQTSGLAIGLVVLSALVLQTRERRRHEAAAHSAIEMARTVAEQLSIYDVAAVKRTLAVVEEEQVVDPELVSHLHSLADNLDSYRPHLPNWMLNDFHEHEMGVGARDGGDNSDTEGEFSVTVDLANTSTNDDPTRTSSSEGVGSVMKHFNLHQQRHAHSTAVMRNGGGGGASPGGKSPGMRSPNPQSLTVPGHHHHNHRTYFAGRVTMACVTFVVAKKIKVQKREELMAMFVDRIHAIATQTNAALHSFIGDQVYASWNTTSKVFQPEAKASKFLIRAAEIVNDEPLLNLSGAAFTGDARCIMAGKAHSAFTVSFRWRETLRALTTYCHRHGAFAVDPATRMATQFDVVTRGIDALLVNDWRAKGSPTAANASASFSSSGNHATRVINVYELVREIPDNETDDEWMYVLRRSAASEGGDKILNFCLAGDYTAALEKLEDEMDVVRANSSAMLTGNGDGAGPGASNSEGRGTRPPGATGSDADDAAAAPGRASLRRSNDDIGAAVAAARARRRSVRTPSKLAGRPVSPARSAGSVSEIGAHSGDDASSVDPYCAASFHQYPGSSKDGASTMAVHGMRLMQHLYNKISRFQRERLPPQRFPEDFTSANWKQ